MIRYNNWMSYSYDGVEYGPKTKDDSMFTLNFNHPTTSTITYKEALYQNARMIADNFTGPFDVCLSGGIDSEVIVRVFNDLKIKQNICIFKFEDDHNIRDVTNAVTLCNNLNIKYQLIDFNLKKFFEDDAIFYAEKIKSAKAGRLPRLKWIDMLDNIPVLGDGEPYWIRNLKDDFTKKSEWSYHLSEDGYASACYSKLIDRVVISDWYEYTPEVLTSYYELPLVKELLADKVPGKQSTYSSRFKIHQDIWPDVIYIPKLVGYEGATKNPGEYPDFMMDFQNHILSKYSNADFCISEEDFKKCLITQQKY